MSSYIIKRLGLSLLTLFGVSVLIFTIINLAPGGPEVVMVGEDMDPALAERMRIRLGLHEPVHVRYFRWVTACLQGDFGFSFRTGHPVLPVVLHNLQRTLILTISALVFSAVVAIAVGVISAVKQYSLFDQVASLIAFMGISVANFWLGLMLMLVFGFHLGWLPISGSGTVGMEAGTLEYFLDRVRHLILPVFALGFMRLAVLVRFARSGMLEVLGQDYVRTARSKGLAERTVVYKHALRNAMISVVTVIGLSIRFLVGGSVVIEEVFAYSGVGRLTASAVYDRDLPIVMGVCLMISVVVLVGNLLTDLAYAYVDPRIRFD